MKKQLKLVLDIGTTGVKAFVFDSREKIIARIYKKLNKKVLGNRATQDPLEILNKSKSALRQVLAQIGNQKDLINRFGIANQRETVIAWDKLTGKPVYPAIVWFDRRTAAYCRKLNSRYEKFVKEKTGLPIDPYFSASKIYWILNNVKQAAVLLSQKRLLFGTVDSWVLWHFGADQTHLTDYTNACRTLLYNIRKNRWDKRLLDIFKIPQECLPKVKNSIDDFGRLKKEIIGLPLPITAVCGDQQASTFAAGTDFYDTKVTFGTGTFVVQVQPRFILKPGFYTTLIPGTSKPKFALEAKIERSGSDVSAAMKDEKKLKQIIAKLADKTAMIVSKLPSWPKQIVIDGGISENIGLLGILRKKTGLRVVKQKVYDGTALGIARMLSKK